MYTFDSTNLKIVTYRRKSTEDEDRQVASLPDQATALNDVATRLHLGASQMVADFGESQSAKQSHVRPQFQRMVDTIARGEANAILTWHPDRLSRNLGDIDTLIQLLESRRLVAIITPQYMFGNTPLEKYILISECTRAKLENDNRGVNVQRGLAGKLRKGWRPGVAPIGYLNDMASPKGEHTIVADPERFGKVRRLLRAFLTGQYSVRQLQRFANSGLLLRTRQTKRQGGKPLNLSHVYRILVDPFYCGKFWWKGADGSGRELHDGRHPPMITEDEYWQIQALLGRPGRPQRKTRTFAYTALITCGDCGAAITAEEKWQIICGHCKKKFASQGKTGCPRCDVRIDDMERKKLLHYVYYHCTGRKGPCAQKGVRVEDLEQQLDTALARINIAKKYLAWALDTLKADAEAEAATEQHLRHQVKHEETRLRNQLAEINRFIIKQEETGWTLMRKEEALAEKWRLQSELKQLELGHAQGGGDHNGFAETTGLLNYACYARLWLREGSPEQKRDILSVLGSNLTLKDKKLSYDLTYPLPEIERMIEIAPEITSEFEPTNNDGSTTLPGDFTEKIPSLRGAMNAIRTYFATSGNALWRLLYLAQKGGDLSTTTGRGGVSDPNV